MHLKSQFRRNLNLSLDYTTQEFYISLHLFNFCSHVSIIMFIYAVLFLNLTPRCFVTNLYLVMNCFKQVLLLMHRRATNICIFPYNIFFSSYFNGVPVIPILSGNLRDILRIQFSDMQIIILSPFSFITLIRISRKQLHLSEFTQEKRNKEII